MSAAAFIAACSSGNTEKALELLSSGNAAELVNAKDLMGQSALVWCCSLNLEAVIDRMLELQVDLDATGCSVGSTGLSTASNCGHESIVKKLLEKGADPSILDSHGKNALVKACERGYDSIVDILLERSTSLDKDKGLLAAAAYDQLHIAQKLVQSGADVNAQDEKSQSPLIVASSKGHTSICEYLLQHGADVTPKDDQGGTALYRACENGHLAVVKLLVEQYNGNLEDQDVRQRGVLSVAIEKVRTEVVDYLLSKGVSPLTRDKLGNTPLRFAISLGLEDIAMRLLGQGAFAYEVPDVQRAADEKAGAPAGMSLFAYAALRGQVRVLRKLLEEGYTPFHERDSGAQAFANLLKHKLYDYATALVLRGASVPEIAHSEAQLGPLSLAIVEKQEALALALLGRVPQCHVAHPEDVCDRDWNAPSAGSEGTVQPPPIPENLDLFGLPVLQLDLDKRDKFSATPLLWACDRGLASVARVLVACGANIDARAGDGGTPLLVATQKGWTEIAVLLIKKGADSRVVDPDTKKNALQHAKENRMVEVVRLLE